MVVRENGNTGSVAQFPMELNGDILTLTFGTGVTQTSITFERYIPEASLASDGSGDGT